MFHRRYIVLACRVILLCIFLLFWEFLGKLNPAVAFFASSPSLVFPQFIKMVVFENLLYHFFLTASEAFVGFSLGTVVGTSIGLLLWYSRFAAEVLSSFVLIAGSIPLITLAPLFIVWFGIGFTMKAALAFFSTVFLSLSQSYRGSISVNKDFSEVLTAMKAPRSLIFIKAIIPGSLNGVLQSMRLNIGLGLLGAFLGEFIASQAGLGYIILRASSLYDIPRAYAAAIGIGILALVFDRVAALVEDKSLRIVEIVSVPRIAWKKY